MPGEFQYRTRIGLLCTSREEKIDKLTEGFQGAGFPQLEGDKVTFIGSTFLKYGDEKPYLNNCLALDTCDNVDEIENTEIDSFNTERELLMAWKNLILKENGTKKSLQNF